MSIPVLDLKEATDARGRAAFVGKLYAALSTWGAFVVTGHDVDNELQDRLLSQLQQFFSLPEEQKMALDVSKGGQAWRGYMKLGGECTHGQTDQKEGLYVGPDHGPDHPRVKTATWLYGVNQLPDAQLPLLRKLLCDYIEQVTQLGNRLMELLSQSLGLPESYIWDHVTCADPIALVRAFNYPPVAGTQPAEQQMWGIGEHTDYGLFTILKTDAAGLQFKHPEHGWVDVPLLPNTFVCNAGDILDRMTDGRLKSRPHRARNLSATRPRLSIPFFYDPCWDAEMKQLPLEHLPLEEDVDRQARWDATSITKLEGPYSSFLAKKVSRVFPQLKDVAAELHTTKAPSTRFVITVK